MRVTMVAVALLAALLLLLVPAVWAHGDHPPKYGGSVGRGDDDIVMEFVVHEGTVTVYLDDEQGAPIAADGMKGTLTLSGAQHPAREARLVYAGANKLVAPGAAPLPGDRMRARVTLPTGKTLQSMCLYSR